mgnify:FL=1
MKYSGLNNKTIYEYHQLTLYEFEKGISLEEIQFMLKEYENQELYLECAGIHAGLEWVKFALLVEIIKLLDYKDTKIKIKDNDN